MLIVCLGDLLLDVIVRLDEPLAPGADAVAVTHAGAGGQAANVAAWAAELGAEARFVGKRGADAAGRLAEEEFRARGVGCLGEDDAELPVVPGPVVDSTGAGDALAAGFLVGGPQLAVKAAARCVAKLGTMP